MICCSCGNDKAELVIVGHESMPICDGCTWGVEDINKANTSGDSWLRFWAKLQELGMRFRPAQGNGYLPPREKKNIYKN